MSEALLPSRSSPSLQPAAVVAMTTTMAAVDGNVANLHCRKRSFDLVLDNEPTVRPKTSANHSHGPFVRSVTSPTFSSPERPRPKRRSRSVAHTPSMPIHLASVMSTTYPSFMSVYGSDEGQTEADHANLSHVQQKEQEHQLGQLNTYGTSRINHSLPFSIHHRGSVNSFTTESITSSPNTAHSSPLFTDPSPASSPESASSNPPLSHFKGTMQSSNHERQTTPGQVITSQQRDLPIYPQTNAPDEEGRNVKKLSLNMSAAVFPRPLSSNGLDIHQPFSAPTSPLREPLKSARRKPTNLTIRTPGFQQLTFGRSITEVPLTPNSRPSLQTFQSSPSLPSLTTPTTSSSGGLHLSLPSFGSGHSRPGSDSSFSSQCVSGVLPEVKEEFEPHKSQEAQERGYPNGPVCIYDCGVYLYLEPTAEEAGQFDTVINVAKEVKNPFERSSGKNRTIMSVWREPGNRDNIIEPQTAVSEMSFKSAWEFQPVETPTVETPKPGSDALDKQPEYLHVPWDHNSEILDDLFCLCNIIDSRIQQGKRVLIHCQLGVSRSASLIIAYGLWKGYQPDFHSMYMQVKERSQWVGPNMSLIYQLTDFRSRVARGENVSGARAAPDAWFKNRSPAPSTASRSLRNDVSLLSLSEDLNSRPEFSDDSSKPPTAKPFRSIKLDKELPPVPLFPKDDKPRVFSHIAAQMTMPPKGAGKRAASPTPSRSNSTARNMKMEPRPLPFRKLAEYASPPFIPPHRPRHVATTMLTIERPPSQMDLATQDVPSTPSLFSPRATEFMASPFGISSTVGDLAVNGPKSARSVRSIAPPTEDMIASVTNAKRKPRESVLLSAIDPRSPHQVGETREILYHIDDFL